MIGRGTVLMIERGKFVVCKMLIDTRSDEQCIKTSTVASADIVLNTVTYTADLRFLINAKSVEL